MTEIKVGAGGQGRVVLRGNLDAQNTGRCWRKLKRALHGKEIRQLNVDARDLVMDGKIAVLFLRWLSEGGMTPGAHVRIEGLSPEQSRVLTSFGTLDLQPPTLPRRKYGSLFEEIGRWTRGRLVEFHDEIAFVGEVPRVLPGVLLNARLRRWREVRRLFEMAGVNALPVIGVFSALVGFVLALEASQPLRQFGAQLYIADMLGFATIRDTGPLVTAIMLAARSGSAFAAELGTMKVNQELDALRTMGLSPVRFLVVQRMAAMLVVSPLLTLYAMAIGMLGGVVVMRILGFPPLMIYHQIAGRVHNGDLAVGLTKSLIFGLIVGGVGCLRGLQTKQGPSAVGVATTRAVVSGILLIIISDTVFSAVLHFLNL